jgi:hypothetical protein
MPADLTSLPVEYLFTMRADTSGFKPIPDGPNGSRLLVTVTGGTVTGPRVNGTLLAGGGDWVTMRPDGTGQLDVRVTIETDDGAVILMCYSGILGADMVARSAPLFQVSHENYRWLNNVQAIGIGHPTRSDVTYDVYAVL